MESIEDYEGFFNNHNLTDPDYILPELPDVLAPEIQPIQIVALVLYAIVFLLGVPGNAIVVWVTAFCMPRSVTSIWFLNLALADLLCCLSLPLLMVPLAHDDHWHFGPQACTLIKSVFYLVMFCSVLQLVVISVDRCLLVTRPIWCQNHRRSKWGAWGCLAIWCLALIGSIPQFIHTKEIKAGKEKRECLMVYTLISAQLITSYRFLVGFVIPFLVIVACHWVVYTKAERGLTRGRSRSKRMVRVILGVVLSFFLCWLPLHIVDFIFLVPRKSVHGPSLYMAHVLTVCLAYFNSCLNPLLYVCLGRGFKESLSRSLRNTFNFITEEQTAKVSVSQGDTKSTSNGKEATGV